MSSRETYLAGVEALDRDPNIDMLLLQEELPRAPGGARTEAYLRGVEAYVAAGARKPIAFVSVLSHGHSEYSRTLRTELPHLSFLNEAGKALRAIDLAIWRSQLVAAPSQAAPRREIDDGALAHFTALARDDGPVALGEVQSKELLRRYGIRTPREALAKSPQEAARIAGEIGYPVVLKIVSPTVVHKSDIGGVLLGLRSEAELAEGYGAILGNARAHGIDALGGVLVCEHAAGGVELAFGVHRDPEMGLIVMAGGGGVLLE